MKRQIETIFTHESEKGIEGRLGIDEDAKLYWNEQPILTKQEVELRWWVDLSIIITALSTLAIAIFAGLEFFR